MSRQAWFQRYFFVYWLVFAGFFLVNSTYRVYSFLHDRTDIWWTPLTMLVPLGTSQDRVAVRSEEHTSELQSQSNLVCRLLLEKKKKNNMNLLWLITTIR